MSGPDHSSPQETDPDGLTRVGWLEALGFWFKLGFISFGGPAGQIALMHEELVVRRRWISEKRFLHALHYCMVLPGPEAQQLATYIGWLLHKTWGGIGAGVLFVLPSLFILIALSWVYLSYGDVPWIEGLFYGVKPAVTALVIHAAYRIGSRTLSNPTLWVIAAASFLAIFFLNLPFPLIILAAAVIGVLGGRIYPAAFGSEGSHPSSEPSTGASVMGDHTPAPQHTLFNWQRLCLVLLVGGLLWVLPMGFLVLKFGGEHTLTQMSWFFTKAALLTFGGAYAVLPYVYQGAVEQFGWVTATQMMDGLALGETTPGPLIMVVTFVGFIGGYAQAVLGPDSLFWSGALAATLVTWFTFLPSFIFILAGGPLVESTHNDLKFTAPLVAITAAVVGVILNLAVFFGYHLLWPSGLGGHLDMFAAAVALSAAIALLKFKLNVIYVIAACGLAGMAYRLIM